VNQQRWGNPLVFANYEYSLHNGLHPDRWPRAQRYGLFNLVRVPLGLEYYLAPIWAVRRSGDRLWLESSHQRLLDSAELPPASFLWTDPLPIALGLVALRMSWRPRQAVPTDRPAAAAIAIGLMVPAVLMLSAISMTHRYRADFYPLLDFAAFLGCYLLIGPRAPALARRRSGRWIVALALLGIIASHITLVLYKASNFGNGSKRLRSGIVAYYREQLAERLPWLTRAAP
jgi:hypothetical protein